MGDLQTLNKLKETLRHLGYTDQQDIIIENEEIYFFKNPTTKDRLNLSVEFC